MQIQGNYSTIFAQRVSDRIQAYSGEKRLTPSNPSPQDTVEQSKVSKMMAGMLSFDKGTASNTTLHVDNNTFQKIASYSTFHPDTKWSELGVDENKRWVVINGQRFESEKTEEEKALAKRMQMTLVDHLQEMEEQQKEMASKEKTILDFLNGHTEANASQHPKIQNLLQNEEVMEMLKNISKSTRGQISISF
ncbi:hypothetical protein DV702_11320 [Sporosarcina sp. PTS2304]|uniref:hypothetical protein n=1 Tax=Sporosarcina sp. PTS2304 TaxID=2283194 RepID=UPI000E0CC607|nr:hypothetical protein [Sporosarcina sp. PTS2304]AXI00261.1 hypothetical protein DV702_11320 [Sporosarcina sp. PTS2304]